MAGLAAPSDLTPADKSHHLSDAQAPKPPLDPTLRAKLSVMMFLQFAVWGSWFVVLGVYLGKGLGFDGFEIGSVYGTMALGAILSTMFAGQLADRYVPCQWLMVGFHLAGAGLLYAMSQAESYNSFWWLALAYALVYNPTLAVSNTLAFANIPDATRDFPTLRVLGTIGWIAAGLGVDFILPEGAAQTNKPLLMAAVLSLALAAFSGFLPHTPPTGKAGDSLPFLRAFGLLGDFSFAVFFLTSFVITIALAFYYGFTGVFLESIGVQKTATVMSFGQMSEIGFMLLLPLALLRLGMKWVLVVGMAAWAVRYACFAIGADGTPYALLLLGVILHGLCFDFFLAAGFIHTDNKAPLEIRGSAQALFSFLTYGVGMWLGNLVSGLLVKAYTVTGPDGVILERDWATIWQIPAVGALVCLVVFALLWSDSPGRAESQPANEQPANEQPAPTPTSVPDTPTAPAPAS